MMHDISSDLQRFPDACPRQIVPVPIQQRVCIRLRFITVTGGHE